MALGAGSVAAEGDKAWCREHYWHLHEEEKDQPGVAAVLGTMMGIALYMLLEYVVHYGPEYIATKKTAKISTVADLEAALPLRATGKVTTAGLDDDIVIKYFESTWVPKSVPSAVIRARRLAGALLIYIPVLLIFILRIQGALDVPYVPEACVEDIALEGRDWVAISIFNCVPFALASLTVLRAMVDCVIIRWGTHLGNGCGSRGAMLWPPYPPLWFIVNGLGWGIRMLYDVVTWSLCAAMVPEASRIMRNGNASEQTTVEEEMGLVANVDGGETSKADEPPAYREAVEGKGARQ